ncbi:PLP-dependent aminotransferase family protein [Actinomyces vulturis]|uniref:aminotransferase-like domain-containing protein n=1 Tax=Actinomyces vulturis TaxID=1857645 RepID=UPI00316ADED1
MPNLKDLPLTEIAQATERMLRRNGASALQYGNGQGLPLLRDLIPHVMAMEGIHAHADDIVVTTGSQQAVDLLTEVFIDPGDVILAEAPTYVGSLGIFNAYEADVHHVPLDADGLIPQALEETIQRLKREGKRVKFLYTLPNFHNPAGVCMSEERRPQIVDICDRHRVLIVEDNPYGLLSFEGRTYTALKDLNPDGVVYLGSFSKIFAPGYRVGWAVAPPAVKEKIKLASEAAILCPSSMGQYSIAMYLNEFDWKAQIEAFRVMYKERRDAMIGALNEYLPYCSWNTPTGGFYTWVGLPEGLDAHEMLPRAITNLVAYVSGTAFYADDQGHDHMRLSFCYPEPAEIHEGIRRLAEVVDAERDLVRIFGPAHHPSPTGIQRPQPDQI